MHSRIQAVVDAAQNLNDEWTKLVTRWTNSSLSLDTEYPRLHGATFTQFNQRVLATLELVRSLGRVDDTGQLLFLPKLDLVTKHLKIAHTAVNQMLNEFKAREDATWKDVGSNLESLQGYVNGSHVATVNTAQHIEQLNGALIALFDIVSSGLKVGRAKGLSVFLGYGEHLQQQIAATEKLREDLINFRANVSQLVTQAQQQAKFAEEYAEGAEEYSTTASTASGAVREAQAEAEAKIAVIRETAKAAAALDAQVNSYSSTFEGFQKSLDERIELHNNFEKSMAEAMSKNEHREEEIDRLIAKSNAMIKGATTAGLGDSLEQTRQLYHRRMLWTGFYFFASVLLLAASAIPLVAHILPGLFGSWLPASPSAQGAITANIGPVAGSISTGPISHENGSALVSLLGRVFLLFPATWLTQFFSKAYSEFFHLEREYAHKAALARSVEGFKKQAPKYEEEITTAVFFEVQTNPSKQKAPDAAEHPILGPLMKKFIDALPLGKSPNSQPPAPK